MARTRSRGINSLDDNALLAVFGFLELRERLAGPALVCRRWHELSTSCSFGELAVSMPPDASGGVLPRLRALLLWLLRRTAQAEPRSLVLSLWDGGPCAAPPTGEAAAEAVALLNSCATACASLERLCIVHSHHYVPNGWTQALRGLREVRLRSRSRLHLLTTWAGLTALRSLELEAAGIALAPGATLPTSLTQLTLAGDQGAHMPHQVGDLVSLHTLRLRGVAYDAGCGYEELRRLPALRALHLDGCRLPACLPRLTALQHLRLRGCVVEQGQAEQAERAGVDAALRSLTHLTCLSLEQLPPAAASPQALAALRSLKALSLVPCTSCASCAGASPYAAGKGASWPPGLRSLTTTFALAAAPGLGALPQLRRLRLVDAPAADGEPPEAWPRFWRWAESHPPLAQLELAPPPPEQAAPLGKACARLVARRPALRIAQHAPGAAAPPTRGALPV